MEGFLIFLLIIFVLPYLLIRLLPYILKIWVNKKIKESQKMASPYDKNKKEGEVFVSQNVNKPSNSEKIVGDDMGEYVDFETVKEDKNGDI